MPALSVLPTPRSKGILDEIKGLFGKIIRLSLAVNRKVIGKSQKKGWQGNGFAIALCARIRESGGCLLQAYFLKKPSDFGQGLRAGDML